MSHMNNSDSKVGTGGAWVSHLAFAFWKILFAILCPPHLLFGGWPAMIMAGCLVVVITGMCGDFLRLMACWLGCRVELLGFIVLGLGLSLPDILA